jgi:hypothetical protein
MLPDVGEERQEDFRFWILDSVEIKTIQNLKSKI